MNSNEVRKIFINFFKQLDHKIIPSSSLIPADPTVLFTSAGMQQFIPYLSGETIPPYPRACSYQKCFRTSDIDKVGDEFHHTFFEMLGNWSFGDYFKEKAIKWSLDLLVGKYGLKKDKIWVTVFKGNNDIKKDTESIEIWMRNGIPRERILEFGMEDNFWGPVSTTGPCGPCSEIYYDRGEKFRTKKCDLSNCGPGCHCGRFVEIWNLVFMEYKKNVDETFSKLPAKNVDTGAGLERLTAVLESKESDYETDLFLPLIKKISELSGKSYENNKKPFRIIADHIRASCFLIADGIFPSKEDRGYILRRLLRRVIRFGKTIDMPKNFLIPLSQIVINQYSLLYPELKHKENDILTIVQNEEEKFEKTLLLGLKKFNKIAKETINKNKKNIDPEYVFHLYDTYGFPFELTKELAKERGLNVDEKSFREKFKKHQEISRAGVEKKFGGHNIYAIKDEKAKIKATKLHTATHLLQAALRQILGNHIQQAGSDINPERLRFDFTHPKKLTKEEIEKVENLVNQKIKEDLPIKVEEMSYENAIKSGALAFFKERYPKIVKVYTIGNFSKEICAGPHVKRTGEIGKFKILKEKSAGAGIRRIKATIIE